MVFGRRAGLRGKRPESSSLADRILPEVFQLIINVIVCLFQVRYSPGIAFKTASGRVSSRQPTQLSVRERDEASASRMLLSVFREISFPRLWRRTSGRDVWKALIPSEAPLRPHDWWHEWSTRSRDF